MKQFAVCLLVLTWAATTANAQYTKQLQQPKQGQGTVTITQSQEVDDLVNGKQKVNTAAQTNTTKPKPQAQTQTAKPVALKQDVKPEPKKEPEKKEPEPKKEPEKKSNEETAGNAAAEAARERERSLRAETQPDTEVVTNATPGKKIVRGAKKVPGYRIQVYSGGNTRQDRIKAEQTSDRMKAAFPDQPIYTHFKSPRWLCRMGNFKSYNEAVKVLRQVKSMGYKTATIVKGTITVME